MKCYACQAILRPVGNLPEFHPVLVNGEPLDSDPWEYEDKGNGYQYQNALWIGLHGGYEMFVDNLDATWPAEDGGEKCTLGGHPDYEAVICHDCAHDACEKLPWLARMIRPEHSHAHSGHEHPRLEAEGHIGWDLQNCCAEHNGKPFAEWHT